MRLTRYDSPLVRFWSQVRTSAGCWEWTGGKTPFGYGTFKIGNRPRAAHRFAWELANGPIPDKLSVLHRCDNPSCVRFDHLFTGTQGDNVRDAASKGRLARGQRNGKHTHPEKRQRGDSHWQRRTPERAARGERVGGAKLTENQVREIRALRSEGATLISIAALYGVRLTNIQQIVTRQTWRHVN